MTTKLGKFLMVLVVAGLSTSWLLAQDTRSDSKDKGDTRTITGCLSKGDNSHEFLLTGRDGSTWEVRSSNVSLADHVGHEVSATGVVSNAIAHNLKEDAKDAAQDAHITKHNTEHGHMKVTDVQTVSDTCHGQ